MTALNILVYVALIVYVLARRVSGQLSIRDGVAFMQWGPGRPRP